MRRSILSSKSVNDISPRADEAMPLRRKTPPTQKCPHPGHWPSLVDLQNNTISEHACYPFPHQNTHVVFNTKNSMPTELGGVTTQKNLTEHGHGPRVQQREKRNEEEKKSSRRRRVITSGAAAESSPARAGKRGSDARRTDGSATGTKARASATDQRPAARRGPGARPV